MLQETDTSVVFEFPLLAFLPFAKWPLGVTSSRPNYITWAAANESKAAAQ
jgi:hypothetical protein